MLALYQHPGAGGGKLAVLGSAAMMSDSYIDKEDNNRWNININDVDNDNCHNRVKDVILSFLTGDEVTLNKIDAEDPEVCYLALTRDS